jgi:hypothetical protein
MGLDLEYFSEEVASVLAGCPDPQLPLVRSEMRTHPRLDSVARQSARELFPGARDPESAHSGLLLMMGGWQQAHEAAQEIARREGSYWHAITHRIEPDIWNAGYWFRLVGSHPIFEDLRNGVAEIIAQNPDARWTIREAWDPFRFLDLCEMAASEKDGASHRLAIAIQSLEWRLLFEWCAAKTAR